jgi:N-methylhydantoinase A
VCEAFGEMLEQGRSWLGQEAVPEERRAFRRFMEARYLGQNHEVVVPVESVEADGLDAFVAAFRRAHLAEYGYDVTGREIEIVNCRLQAAGRLLHRPLLRGGEPPKEKPVAMKRRVHFGAHGWLETEVFEREGLASGSEIPGPAVIEEMSSTTIVFPGQQAQVDAIGNIILTVSPA